MTIAPCGRIDPHEHHVWTPEPRAIHGPKRCPGVVARIPAGDFGRLEAYVAEYVNDSPAALRAQVVEAQHNALEMARKADLAERRAEEAEYHVEQLRDALDSAERRLEQAERRAECAEDGNRGLIATCEAAGAKIQALEAAIGRARKVLNGWECDGPDDPAIHLLIQRVRTALDESRGEVGTGAGEGATGQDTGAAWVTRSGDCPEAPAQAHLPACNCVPGICAEGDECCESHDCPGSGCEHEWLDRPESDTRECLICGVEVAG